MCKMPVKTYFVLMRGSKSSLLPIVLDILPGSKILWAGTGDWVVDAPWVLSPRTGQVWDLALVLETDHHQHHVDSKLKKHLDLYAVEVSPMEWKPSEKEMKKADMMDPGNEPEGIMEVWRHNWQQLLSVYALARNVLRVTRILMWLALSILRWNLFEPFHMINLLKFRDNDESIYDEYRDCAGKLVLAKGGSLAFLGRVKGADSHTWDEVMVVAYKTRWQFMQMALLTPGYWPLAMLRDEGLQDGALYPVNPVSLGN